MLYRYEDYSEYDISEFEDKHSEIWQIWEKSIDSDLTEKFMQVIYHNADVTVQFFEEDMITASNKKIDKYL